MQVLTRYKVTVVSMPKHFVKLSYEQNGYEFSSSYYTPSLANAAIELWKEGQLLGFAEGTILSETAKMTFV